DRELLEARNGHLQNRLQRVARGDGDRAARVPGDQRVADCWVASWQARLGAAAQEDPADAGLLPDEVGSGGAGIARGRSNRGSGLGGPRDEREAEGGSSEDPEHAQALRSLGERGFVREDKHW